MAFLYIRLAKTYIAVLAGLELLAYEVCEVAGKNQLFEVMKKVGF